MNKYIVKNCPAISKTEILLTSYPPQLRTAFKCGMKNEFGISLSQNCENCTDCLLKQVLEKCKNAGCKDADCEYKDQKGCLECGENIAGIFAEEILQLIEIEECE